jgi:hypothetical protein
MITMITIAPKLINMEYSFWCLGGKRGVPDPAEPGGRGWMAGSVGRVANANRGSAVSATS